MKAVRHTLASLLGLSVFAFPCLSQGVGPEFRESPVADVTVCQILAFPQDFDQKQLRIDAYLSREFESARLVDRSCPDEAYVNELKTDPQPHTIWWEFANEVEHEGVKGYLPLVENGSLQQLAELMNQRIDQMPRATLIGTFYAAEPPTQPEPNKIHFPRGYGHMGCCHLFVVSRVEWVETSYAANLDYSAEWSARLPKDCYSFEDAGIPSNDVLRAWQKEAISETNDWRNDPLKVAQKQLLALRTGPLGESHAMYYERGLSSSDPDSPPPPITPADPRPEETLLETETRAFRKTYEFIASDRKSRTIILIARPYWLEALASSAEKVIWVPVASAEVQCFAPGQPQTTESPDASQTANPTSTTVQQAPK
jgi:hypothetical protein